MIKNESGKIATLKLPKHAEKQAKMACLHAAGLSSRPCNRRSRHTIGALSAAKRIIGKSLSQLACQLAGCVIRYVLSMVYAMNRSSLPASGGALGRSGRVLWRPTFVVAAGEL
jgi:hypothetical protein